MGILIRRIARMVIEAQPRDQWSSAWVANPNLMVMQGALYNPSFSGPGKWVIVNAENRRAFLAVAKDRRPPIIDVLAGVIPKPHTRDASHPYGPHSDTELSAQFADFVSAGLLVAKESSSEPTGALLPLYHRFVSDYPFLNYSGPQWFNEDRALMAEYASQSRPPLIKTSREGRCLPLPSVTIADLQAPPQASGQVLSVQALAAVLRYVLGPIFEIEGRRGGFLRKTSPSGGGLHPTEAVVALPVAIGEIPSGVYVYDVARHGLVNADDEYPTLARPANGDVLRLLLRSRVERAMWRYRDPRSYRAIVLDAGHIAETLAILVAEHRWSVKVQPAPEAHSAVSEWLREPEIALLRVGPSGHSKPLTFERRAGGVVCPDVVNAEALVTNPTVYFTFHETGLVGHTVWPKPHSFPLSLESFDVLTHCLPSRRGDRDTTPHGITTALAEASGSAVNELRALGALLPKTTGEDFYQGAALWTDHGWYLPLLVHLSAQADGLQNTEYQSSETAPKPFLAGDLMTALLRRQTCRSFSQQEVELESIKPLLEEVTVAIEAVGAQHRRPSLYVVSWAIDGLSPGLHRWHSDHRSLEAMDCVISRQEIKHMATGQDWASSGAGVLFFVQEVDTGRPGSYELDIMNLGRAAQRACLAAASQDLGVFVSPALTDSEALAALGIPRTRESVVYLMALGKKRSRRVDAV